MKSMVDFTKFNSIDRYSFIRSSNNINIILPNNENADKLLI